MLPNSFSISKAFYSLTLVLLLFISFNTSGQHVIQLHQSDGLLPINESIYYFEDASHRLSIANVSNDNFASNFIQSQRKKLNFGMNNSTFWVRFDVQNHAKQQEEWLLELAYSAIDKIVLYYQNQEGEWVSKNYGDHLSFKHRDLAYRNFFIKLPKDLSEKKTFFLQLQTQGVSAFPLSLVRSDQLYRVVQYDLIYALFFGAMIVMLIYNLFVFISLRDISFILYVGVIFVAFSYLFSIRGFAFQYVFPNSPWFSNKLTLLSGTLWIFICPLFSNAFLMANKHIPKWSMALKTFSATGLVLFCLAFVLPFNFIAKVLNLVAILACITMIVSGVLTLQKGQRSARFYIVAWAIYLTGIFTLIASNFGLINENIFTFHAGEICSMIEIILLSLALSDRFNLYKQEKEEAQIQALKLQQETNVSLERMVTERTAEIVQQNEEIAMQRDILEKQKNEIGNSYDNLRLLTEIGRQVTASLDLSEIIELAYKNLKSISKADAFGVGVYNKDLFRLDFEGFIEKNNVLDYHFETLSEKHKPSIQCFLTREEINISKEVLATIHIEIGERPSGAFYMPLIMDEEILGVMTVQSFRDSFDNPQTLMLFRNLATYITIGLANAKAFLTIHRKNQDITDSIRYAQTIQQAILPTAREMTNTLGDYFVLFQPCQIVSGDFYWIHKTSESVYVAVVDCTGHGVPGAFMSLIGHTLLNEAVVERYMTRPDQILEWLSNRIGGALKQDVEEGNHDGLDMTLCILTKQIDDTTKVQFAGAKQDLYYTDMGKLLTLKGTRRTVAGWQRNKIPFESCEITISSGEMIYLATDGYPDQHGLKDRRIGSARFRSWLEKGATLALSAQRHKLEQALINHMKGADQRDDITILGFKIQ